MLRSLFLLVAGTLFLSALLTPFVFTGLELLLGTIEWPFSRVFDRVAMVVAAGLLIAYRRTFELGALRPYFRFPPSTLARHAFAGALLTLTASLVFVPLLFWNGELAVGKREYAQYFWKMMGMVPAAFLIGLIEESFFRVLVLQKMASRMPWATAACATSALYAAVHFIAPVKSFAYGGFSPLAGFVYLGAVADRLVDVSLVFPFVGLWLVGMVLALAIRRTGSLALCIGLHAGWVLAMKAVHYSARIPDGIVVPPGIGRRLYLVSAPEVWISIALVGCLVLGYARRHYRSSSLKYGMVGSKA